MRGEKSGKLGKNVEKWMLERSEGGKRKGA